MIEQKVRKFKLIDCEGFINRNTRNKVIMGLYMDNGMFEGVVDEDGDLVPVVTGDGDILISENEFEYFEEVVEVKEEEDDNKKVVQKYIREDFKTRGQALDSYDSGVVLYTPCGEGYHQVNESNILENFGQLFTLEEREETWQDVAQEFIKNNPVLSKDKFVEDMFGNDFSEYHEPMKQLAKIIVEYSR